MTNKPQAVAMRGFKYGADCYIALDPLIEYLDLFKAALQGSGMKEARTTVMLIADELRELKADLEKNYKPLAVVESNDEDSN